MKVSIIGSGAVGSTAAYALVLRRIASELVLIDINKPLAVAQAEDLLHATPFTSPARILAGDYSDLLGSRVVILACGVSQKPGETRLQLLERNARIFREVTGHVVRHSPGSILLIASNPVDIMTNVVARIASIPSRRVIGSGTILDTARFRALVAEHFGVSAQSVHASVLGEHGDSEVLAWSSATIGGVPLQKFMHQSSTTLTADQRASIDARVRGAAYRIIEGKGATFYGIGAGLARIVQAIRDDERTVLTLSNDETPGYGEVAFSLPRVVGAEGIISTLEPQLSSAEEKALRRSADVLRKAAAGIGI